MLFCALFCGIMQDVFPELTSSSNLTEQTELQERMHRKEGLLVYVISLSTALENMTKVSKIMFHKCVVSFALDPCFSLVKAVWRSASANVHIDDKSRPTVDQKQIFFFCSFLKQPILP